MRINITQVGAAKLINVRRDLSHLVTPQAKKWLLEKAPINDYDESDSFREIEEC